MLAATAASLYADVPAAMQGMSGQGDVIRPTPATSAYHAAKFEVFRAMYREQLQRREIMQPF